MFVPTASRRKRAGAMISRLMIVLVCSLACITARSQSTSTIPSEDFGWQHSIPAGPYSVVNTGTGTLVTSIPIVKLTGPGGTVLDFTLFHASTGTGNSVVGQAARGWRHTYDEWIVPNNTPNISTFSQRSTAARGTAEWSRPTTTVPYVRKPGVRDDLTPDPAGFYFTVKGKDQSVSTYSFRRLAGYCLSSIKDTHNNTITVSYDAAYRVSTITDVAGRTLTLGYKDSYSLSYVILTAGSLTRRWDFTTDANSCLTRVDFPAPVANGTRPAIIITPDGAGRILDLYDRNNNHWHYDYYTPAGGPTQLWKVTDPFSGLPVTFNTVYGAGVSTTTITDQFGRVAKHDYTADTTMATTTTYLVNKVTDPKVAADSAAFFETYAWNLVDGTLTSMVDRRGKTWQFTWDSNNYGDMLTQKNPLLQTSQYLYSAQHNVIRTIDPLNHRTLASYDPTYFNLTQTVTDPKTDPNDGTYSNPSGLAVTKNFTYFANGDPSTLQAYPDSATVYGNYDGYGNARTVTDPLGKSFTATFDSLNQKLTSTEPLPGGTTTSGYDLLGRLTSVTHPDLKLISYGYDVASNRTSVTDENSHTTYFDPDVLDRIWRIRQNTNATTTLTTSFVFNNVGDKTQATNPRNYATNYSFDERHKLIQITYPDTTTRKFHYDGNGNRDKRWDGANSLTNYTYDDANRLTLSSYPSGATVSNHYRADGLRDQMVDPTGTSTWAYNGAHLLTSAYFPLTTRAVTYTYDSKGRKATMTAAGTWTYSYDADDHVKTISESFGFSPSVTFNYNDNGSLDNKLLANNTRTYFTYDNRNRTKNISHRFWNGSAETEQQAVGYTYDDAGNPLTYTDNAIAAGQSWSTSFQFDWANRLTNEIQTGSAGGTFNNVYAYDGNGNRTSVTRNGVLSTYNVDNNDKFVSGDGYTFSNYDNNGNPRTAVSGGVTLGLTYDYENQLTQITYSNGTPTSIFLYNGDNLRVQKTDHTGTTDMLYDGTSLICETNASGSTIEAWYNPGVGFRRSGASYYFRENGIGSTLQVTNNVGATVNRYEYDSYGVTSTFLEGQVNLHKFAGKHGYYSDNDSGMQLLGHRYYLPMLGRFLTQDPLGHGAGLNLYQYASQNPLVRVDPLGDSDDPVDDAIRGSFTTTGTIIGMIVGGTTAGGAGAIATGGIGAAPAAVGGIAGGGAIGAGGGYLIGELAVGLRHGFNYVFSGSSSSGREGAPAQPSTPNGMTNAQFGKLVGWGSRPSGALQRMKSLTDADVVAMKEGGLTRELARDWAQFYRDFNLYLSEAGKNALPTPFARARLMDEIVRRWPK